MSNKNNTNEIKKFPINKEINLDLWNRVEKTDKAFIKPVAFGSRKFTAIDPQYQVREVTREFGVIGHGWGWENTTEFIQLSNGDCAVVANVHIWTKDKANRYGAFTGCRTFYNAKKDKVNEDAPKMAITDGLTKAISHLGFNADVFLGKMDGNKYTANNNTDF